MYQLVRGKPIEEIEFTMIKARSGKYKNRMVYDNIFTFDTETTSDYLDENGCPFMFDYDNPKLAQDSQKHSLCYLWQFGIDEDTRYIGRELTDFVDLLYKLKQYTSDRAIKICFIHNLSFDFNFLINILHFDDVFARTPRHPMCATCREYNIEFRCSFILTGLKLETWAESLKLPVRKKVGLLDYRVMRTPLTPLSKDNLDYAIADLDCMYFGLKKFRDAYGGIAYIPLTHTGEMRYECEKVMEKQTYYCEKVTKLLPQSIEEYNAQSHAFIGGTVLCNWLFKNRVIRDVDQWDIASSYPWVLISCLYPSTPFVKVPKSKYKKYMYNREYVYLVDFTVTNFTSNYNCHFMSKSKAISIKGCEVDNGRIIKASEGRFILTSVDFEIFIRAYKFKQKDLKINEFKISHARPLNDNFRRFIIDLYKDKTTLKNVEGKEDVYQSKKALINSGYGDFVTKVFCGQITFDYNNPDGKVWDEIPLDDASFQKKLNTLNKKRFKNYKAFIHGVFCTAWARSRIWNAIIDGEYNGIICGGLDESLVYTDTDSLKVIGDCTEYFERENRLVLTRHQEIAQDLNINVDDLSPVDIKGIPHPIGVWENEGVVDFKSLGCKQYLTIDKKGKKKLTCAGVSKLAVQCFETFDDFTIDTKLTEKMLLNCTDGKGHTAEKLTPYYSTQYPVVKYPDGYVCKYKSGVCLMPTTFNLSITGSDLLLLYDDVIQRLNQIYYKRGVKL